jgi:hypothetical protein
MSDIRRSRSEAQPSGVSWIDREYKGGIYV